MVGRSGRMTDADPSVSQSQLFSIVSGNLSPPAANCARRASRSPPAASEGAAVMRQ